MRKSSFNYIAQYILSLMLTQTKTRTFPKTGSGQTLEKLRCKGVVCDQGARPIVCSNPLVEVGYVASSVGYALPLVNWATSTNQSAYYAHDNHTRVKHAPTHT